VGEVIGEYHVPCTQKTSFADFEKRVKALAFNQMSLTRLIDAHHSTLTNVVLNSRISGGMVSVQAWSEKITMIYIIWR
jgi:hypothetical protein